MTERTWTFLDKSSWPSGAWDDEPDKAQWTDAATGLTCMARRNPRLGHWCGYVGVPSGHPFHGVDYDSIEVGAHGGVNYSDLCDGDEERGICHLPEPGQPDDLWWLGFDCAHYRDLTPAHADFYGDATYRDLPYVRSECASLAAQIASAS